MYSLTHSHASLKRLAAGHRASILELEERVQIQARRLVTRTELWFVAPSGFLRSRASWVSSPGPLGEIRQRKLMPVSRETRAAGEGQRHTHRPRFSQRKAPRLTTANVDVATGDEFEERFRVGYVRKP